MRTFTGIEGPQEVYIEDHDVDFDAEFVNDEGEFVDDADSGALGAVIRDSISVFGQSRSPIRMSVVINVNWATALCLLTVAEKLTVRVKPWRVTASDKKDASTTCLNNLVQEKPGEQNFRVFSEMRG